MREGGGVAAGSAAPSDAAFLDKPMWRVWRYASSVCVLVVPSSGAEAAG
jgi:hypothetical protein